MSEFDFKFFTKKNKPINYDYKGKLNTENHKDFKNLCRLSQKKLKKYLKRKLRFYYEEVIDGDGFLYVRGINSNILLTAHMDTVHKKICKDIYEYSEKGKTVLSSPQGIGGDDRCGVYAILKILEQTEFRPFILFCEDEEIGGVGSDKFCWTKYANDFSNTVNFMIEIDRANRNDCVFYDETNKDFIEYIKTNTGTEEAFGSFSDICHLSEKSGISSVNLSCGYYNAHTSSEYVVMEEVDECIGKVKKLLEINQRDNEPFGYIPRIDTYFGNSYDSGFWGDYGTEMEFIYTDDSGKQYTEIVEGKSKTECIGKFMIEHPDLCWNQVLDYIEY